MTAPTTNKETAMSAQTAATTATARKRTAARPVTPAQRERADELFDLLSSLLRDAADPDADPAVTLRRADRAFDTLHRHFQRGGALPTPWLRARH